MIRRDFCESRLFIFPGHANMRAMLELEDARSRILAALGPLSVAIASAAGRFTAGAIVSPLDLPAFDNSAMDGYAVLAADVATACAAQPASLREIGRVAAGEVFQGGIESGACVRVFTGSPLPAGADAVVMQEDTRIKEPGRIEVLDAVKPWENVRFRGEDVKQGMELIGAGLRLNASRLGLLAAVGMASVPVRRQPIVGVLATGNELVEGGHPLSPGKIYESNRVMLRPLLAQAGATARMFPLVSDTLEATRAALERAFEECDAVVTSGGVSVGQLDFVKAAFEKLGGTQEFWKVSIRPGKPFVFGRLGGKCLFGLPGNPVSALVTFLMLVRPALLHWQGAVDVELPSQACVLGEALVNRGDRRHFMRVKVDAGGIVRPAGAQSSHRLGSLAEANGLVDVPPGVTLAAGTPTRVWRLDD
jgi:molybdopterin molybdotransferase